MKISKVKHTRTAVSRQKITKEKKDAAIGGILYNNPANKGVVQPNLEGYVTNLNKTAQNLYNVFNPMDTKGKKYNDLSYEENNIKYMINNFNSITKYILDMNSSEIYGVTKNHSDNIEDDCIQKQIYYLKNFLDTEITVGKDKEKKPIKKCGRKLYIKITEEYTETNLENQVKDIVSKYLRNSLRIYYTDKDTKERIYIPDIIEKLAFAFCRGNKYPNVYSGIPENHIIMVLKAINEDYTKRRRITLAVRSIKNQNVKVQPTKDGILQLSGADHVDEKKDYKSKKYVYDYIRDYACVDEDYRKEKMLHMRKLIILYFYGEEMYKNPPKDISAISFGKQLLMDEGVFSQMAWEKLNDYNKDVEDYKELQIKVKEYLRKEIADRYYNYFVDNRVELSAEDYFWLNWITGELEKIYFGGSGGKKTAVKQKQLSNIYLCKRIWNNWTAYIAMKYVDLGKAVYHFATPDIMDLQRGENVEYGKALPEFKDGITSFDYERIKADESLERGITTYITFAANTFAQATIEEKFRISDNNGKGKEEKEDILYNAHFIDESYSDSTRRVLQYFGGQSKWSEKITEWDRDDFLETMRQAVRFVRDGVAHYTATGNIDDKMNVKLLETMYNEEMSWMGKLYAEKYCTNNAMRYYSSENIISLIKKMYKSKNDVKRMPAFKTVIKRSDMEMTVREYLGDNYYNTNIAKYADEDKRKLDSLLYYIMSEIYYHDFIMLPEKDQKELFKKEVDALDIKDKKNGNAAKDFIRRINELTDNDANCTLEKICEIIMTDYNMQNMEKEKIASRDTEAEKENKKYKHFPILLRQCLKEALIKYINQKEEYGFLKKPVLNNDEYIKDREANFVNDITKLRISEHFKLDMGDERLFAWYVVAHFLSPKYLNHLNGLILSYIQLVNSINDRAAMNGNRTVDYSTKLDYYRNVVKVINFVRNYVGKVSVEITDYFSGDKAQAEEEYAKHLANYVNFYDDKDNRSYAVSLKEFAMQSIDIGSPSGYVEIYFDGDNPKLNRNIILTMLYGNIKAVRENVKKITFDDIKEYYKIQDELKDVLQSGKCNNTKQLGNYKQYQLMKNRIELVDVKIFSEIINDLQAKLISWSYLRERDLMYYQLGVHYIRLQYIDDEGKELVGKIDTDKVHITDGGLLYQIIALNTYTLPTYKIDNGRTVVASKKGNFGAKIGGFLNCYGINTYNWALELFEHIVEHDDIIAERNYIDHFKYYVLSDQSIMDMYGEVYDHFFTYDLKLQKSVAYIFADILKSYFVIPNMRLKEVVVSNKRKEASDTYIRKTSYPEIYKELESDELTYKLNIKNEKGYEKKIEHKLPARNKCFLDQLKAILEYKC